MKKCLLSLAVANSFALVSGLAYADAALEETFIWGTKVTSDSVFIGETDIAIKQADHLSDLLRDIPGVDIGGTHSVNARINFRGLDDRDLAVYIDNALQTNYLYHHMGNLLINADILKSAAIDLGANSLVNGGLGGALRFETKDAQDLLEGSDANLGGRVMLGYQDNAQQSASVTAYGRQENVDAIFYAHRVDRDNFEDGTGTDTIGSDGTTDNLLGKIGFNISDTQRIEFSYEGLYDEGDYTQRPDMGVRTNAAITGDLLLPTEYERETLNFGYELNQGDALVLRATVYANDMYLWRDERATITRAGAGTEKEAQADNLGFNVLAASLISTGDIEHTLRYGFELFDQKLSYRGDLSVNAAPVEEEGKSLAVFVEDELSFGALKLTPGLRYNDFEKDIKSTNSSGSWDDVNFALAADYQITEGLNVLGSYTELFKGPELAEVFIGSAENKLINPDVEPEAGENIEIGLRYMTDINGVSYRFGLNVFETTIDNYIAEVAVGGSSTSNWDANVGTAVIDGGELSFNAVFENFEVLLTYAKTDLDDRDLTIDDTTESLRELGDSIGLELASIGLENLNLLYSVRHVLDKDTVGGDTKDGYTVHNVSAAWQATSQLQVNFGIDNLFDRSYTSHASRTGETTHPLFGFLELDDVEPGRNVKASVSYVF